MFHILLKNIKLNFSFKILFFFPLFLDFLGAFWAFIDRTAEELDRKWGRGEMMILHQRAIGWDRTRTCGSCSTAWATRTPLNFNFWPWETQQTSSDFKAHLVAGQVVSIRSRDLYLLMVVSTVAMESLFLRLKNSLWSSGSMWISSQRSIWQTPPADEDHVIESSRAPIKWTWRWNCFLKCETRLYDCFLKWSEKVRNFSTFFPQIRNLSNKYLDIISPGESIFFLVSS